MRQDKIILKSPWGDQSHIDRESSANEGVRKALVTWLYATEIVTFSQILIHSETSGSALCHYAPIDVCMEDLAQ